MKVSKIRLVNFMSHEDTEIDLPSSGVVLVTGANGHGKSAIAEGVAFGAWGKTLRGSSPWASKGGRVFLTVAGASSTLDIVRKQTTKDPIIWSPCETSYATATKAQAALSSILGDFDTWRRCSVFSSQDASHFTLAADAERKRLLESLLGLDRFDEALAACRRDKRDVERNLSDAARELSNTTISIDLKSAAVEDNKRALAALGEGAPKVTPQEIRALEHTIKEQSAFWQADSEDLRDAEEARTELKVSFRSVCALIENLAKDKCPTCEQDITKEYAKALTAELGEDSSKLEGALNRNGSICESLESSLAQARTSIRDSERDLAQKEAWANAPSTDGVRKHLQDSIRAGLEAVGWAKADSKRLTKLVDNLSYRLALLENTETVLGTKGVRAHILGSALGALEATSNKWLKKITGDDISLRIAPYTEKKTGGTREAIALHVDGVAGGHGYKAASGGQRRRIDIAILLGLAELAQASSQTTKGTVFFDEVFDSLDEEGVEAVSVVLDEIAQDRAVVVISHSEVFVDSIHPVAHLHVESGVVLNKIA